MAAVQQRPTCSSARNRRLSVATHGDSSSSAICPHSRGGAGYEGPRQRQLLHSLPPRTTGRMEELRTTLEGKIVRQQAVRQELECAAHMPSAALPGTAPRRSHQPGDAGPQRGESPCCSLLAPLLSLMHLPRSSHGSWATLPTACTSAWPSLARRSLWPFLCVPKACTHMLSLHSLSLTQACVPAWPMYRKHPVVWLPNLPSSSELEESSKAR